MAMNILFAPAIGLLYFIWSILRRYLLTHPLDNLPGPRPVSLLLGCVPEYSDRQSWKSWAQMAETYGPSCVWTNMLNVKSLVTHDPKVLHAVLVKDQDTFPKSLIPHSVFSVLIGPGLLSTHGAQHRRQRKMLNPVFSVAHLRDMTHIFWSVAHKLRAAIQDQIPDGAESEVLDMNGWNGRATLEMLGQAGLGYSFDSFGEESTDDFGESLKMFFPALNRSGLQLPRLAIEYLSYILPRWALRWFLRVLPQRDVREVNKLADIMEKRSQEIIDEKKAALRQGKHEVSHQVGEGKDIMSKFLRANMIAAEAERLTDEELLAQMSTFILAGMDTTSNSLSRTLQVLAEHPAAQNKLREELLEATHGGTADVGYDELVKLPYLDAVCRETMRVYAPVILSARTAMKDTVVTFSRPVHGRDGKILDHLAIPKGTVVIINNQASNVDKTLWGEDASEWKPERWLAGLPAAVEEARIPGVYSNLLTFSGGHRSCIGFRFSQVEMKVIICMLLTSFSFEPTGEPIAWNASSVLYPTMGEQSTKPELLLKVKRLDKH